MSSLQPESERITLVGAGLVGSLLALDFARRGYTVEVLERRPDMRRETISAGRSINLACSVRGFHALKQAGLEAEVLKHAVPMRGRMIHSPTGELTFQAYGKDDSQAIYSVSRGGLNRLLMTAAEATGKVKIRFKARVSAVDLEKRELTLEDGSRETYTRLIGTDGSASAVREAIATRAPGFKQTQEELDYGYKELTIPPGPGGSFLLEKNALHIWPRGKFMLIALPNEEGSFTCTLFLPHTGAEYAFDRLKTPAEVRAFFETHFADALALIPDLEQTYFANPTGHMVTVKAFPWRHRDSALLLGDAAHAIVPFFGQGMNCGFEDCTVLGEWLDQGTHWEQVFTEVERARKPNSDAIADLAVENFVEMRDKVADPHFLLMKEVEKRLLKELPGEFASRYSLVTFSRTPYALAREIGRVADGILEELCRGASSVDQVDFSKARPLARERLSQILKGVM